MADLPKKLTAAERARYELENDIRLRGDYNPAHAAVNPRGKLRVSPRLAAGTALSGGAAAPALAANTAWRNRDAIWSGIKKLFGMGGGAEGRGGEMLPPVSPFGGGNMGDQFYDFRGEQQMDPWAGAQLPDFAGSMPIPGDPPEGTADPFGVNAVPTAPPETPTPQPGTSVAAMSPSPFQPIVPRPSTVVPWGHDVTSERPGPTIRQPGGGVGAPLGAGGAGWNPYQGF